MKILVRALIVWFILGLCFWLWGLPYLITLVTEKTRTDNTRLCKEQLASQGLMPQPVSEAEADTFCGCLSEGITFEQSDLIEMATTRKLSTRLEAAAEAQGRHCQPLLDQAVRGTNLSPPPPDGSVEIQL